MLFQKLDKLCMQNMHTYIISPLPSGVCECMGGWCHVCVLLGEIQCHRRGGAEGDQRSWLAMPLTRVKRTLQPSTVTFASVASFAGAVAALWPHR